MHPPIVPLVTSPALTAVASIAGKIKALKASVPLIVDGIYVPPPAPDAKPVEVWHEANLTPLEGPNYRWKGNATNDRRLPDADGTLGWMLDDDCYDFCSSLGMEKYQVAYVGAFNRASEWSGRASLDEFNRLGYSGAEIQNAYDPPIESACRAIGSLSANPQRFGGTARKGCPILIDVEQGNSLFRGTDTPAQRLVKIKQWRDAIRWMREGAGNAAQEVYFYGEDFWYTPTTPPDATVDAAMAQWQADTTTETRFLYWWEGSFSEPDRWRTDCLSVIASIRKTAPTGGFVVLNPTVEILNIPAHPDLAVFHNKPVPTDQFFGTVSLLAAAGISMAAWTGYAWVDSGVRPHLTFLGMHGTNPQGLAAHYLNRSN